jgi:ornithine cyclodeaminase/alanine dehydrogenase-like protein (mu-crystallin family)
MRVFSAEDVDAALGFPALIDELAEAMRCGFVAPQRHHHAIERAGQPEATHLLMPAWTESASRAGLYLGVKIVNVFPGNSARGLPTVSGLYVLQPGRTGETLAAIDGTRLTLWRTSAAAALAARRLARPDAERLLLVGPARSRRSSRAPMRAFCPSRRSRSGTAAPTARGESPQSLPRRDCPLRRAKTCKALSPRPTSSRARRSRRRR